MYSRYFSTESVSADNDALDLMRSFFCDTLISHFHHTSSEEVDLERFRSVLRVGNSHSRGEHVYGELNDLCLQGAVHVLV